MKASAVEEHHSPRLSPAELRGRWQRKTAAYLAAGAIEVWLVAEDGTVDMFDARGRIVASSFGIAMEPLGGVLGVSL